MWTNCDICVCGKGGVPLPPTAFLQFLIAAGRRKLHDGERWRLVDLCANDVCRRSHRAPCRLTGPPTDASVQRCRRCCCCCCCWCCWCNEPLLCLWQRASKFLQRTCNKRWEIKAGEISTSRFIVRLVYCATAFSQKLRTTRAYISLLCLLFTTLPVFLGRCNGCKCDISIKQCTRWHMTF